MRGEALWFGVGLVLFLTTNALAAHQKAVLLPTLGHQAFKSCSYGSCCSCFAAASLREVLGQPAAAPRPGAAGGGISACQGAYLFAAIRA